MSNTSRRQHLGSTAHCSARSMQAARRASQSGSRAKLCWPGRHRLRLIGFPNNPLPSRGSRALGKPMDDNESKSRFDLVGRRIVVLKYAIYIYIDTISP